MLQNSGLWPKAETMFIVRQLLLEALGFGSESKQGRRMYCREAENAPGGVLASEMAT